MPVPKRRKSKSARDKRRSHHGLKKGTFVMGPNGEMMPHSLVKAARLEMEEKKKKAEKKVKKATEAKKKSEKKAEPAPKKSAKKTTKK